MTKAWEPPPLAVWLEWSQSLPPELAGELDLELSRLWPGGLHIDTSPQEGGLSARLAQLPLNPLESVGLVATLAALTDLVIAERKDPSSWARAEDLLTVLGEASELADHGEKDFRTLVENFTEHARARAPLRQKQWARAAATWETIREIRLGPDALDAARRAARWPSATSAEGD